MSATILALVLLVCAGAAPAGATAGPAVVATAGSPAREDAASRAARPAGDSAAARRLLETVLALAGLAVLTWRSRSPARPPGGGRRLPVPDPASSAG